MESEAEGQQNPKPTLGLGLDLPGSGLLLTSACLSAREQDGSCPSPNLPGTPFGSTYARIRRSPPCSGLQLF